jgi:hypothetical protein
MVARKKSMAVRGSKAGGTLLAQKAAELAIAAPQVVAHRMNRMLTAGPVYSAADQREFTGMVMEKQWAFVQSWTNMWAEAMKLQQSMLLSWFKPVSVQGLWRLAEQGLHPVHAKAVSNARRLNAGALKRGR